MTLHFEVTSRFQHAVDADCLLYAPIRANLTSRHSRCYSAEVEGDVEAASQYLQSVLVEPISQLVSQSAEALLPDYLFYLDYGMKPGALDLEKEAILGNYRGRKDMGFTLKSLVITQRVYVFGSGDAASLGKTFIKDICNPAIHRWNLVTA